MKQATKQTSLTSKLGDFFSNDKRNMWMLYMTFLLFNIALAVQYRAPFVYPDEYGVFAAGNWMLGGVDWAYKSNMYYGYTFSPFVGIFLRLFRDIRYVYVGSLCVKAFQLSFIPVLSYKLLQEVLDMDDAPTNMLLSASVCLYPTIALYAKYVSNETTLHVTLFVCFYLVGKLALVQTRNATRLYSAQLGFFAVFAYASHGMGLAFIAAICLVIPVAHIINKRKLVSYPFFIGSLAVFYLLDSAIKDAVMNAAYYIPSGGMVNTFSYTFNRMMDKLLAPGFIPSFLGIFISRLLYISSSTFGLFLLSLIIVLVFMFQYVKARFTQDTEPQNHTLFVVSVFSLAIFFCGIGLSTLSNVPDPGTESRMYFYGRYYEYMALPLILTGLYRLFSRSVQKMTLLKYFIVSFGCYLVLAFYTQFGVLPYVSDGLNRFFILGILPYIGNTAVELAEDGSQAIPRFDIFTLWLVTTSAFMLMIYLLKGKRRPWALVLLSALFLYGTIVNHVIAVLPLSVANYKHFYSNMEPLEAALTEFEDVYAQYPNLCVASNKLGAGSSSLLFGRAQMSFANYSVEFVINPDDLDEVGDLYEFFGEVIIVSDEDLEILNTDEACLKIYESPNARIWIRGDEIRSYYANR